MNLIKFVFEKTKPIRTVMINGKAWFVANDVATALGYSNPRDIVKRHCKNYMKHSIITKGGKQKLTFIDLNDVESFLIRTKKTDIGFAKWFYENFNPTKTYHKVTREFAFGQEIVYNLFKGYEIKPQFACGKYRIDWYIPELKLAIEFDEAAHRRKVKEDAKRQNFIEKKLGCKFLRYSDY